MFLRKGLFEITGIFLVGANAVKISQCGNSQSSGGSGGGSGSSCTKKEKGSVETLPSITTHTKARAKQYEAPDGGCTRFEVSDEKVPWKVEFPDYNPTQYTVKNIIENKPVWADPDVTDDAFSGIKFNELDGSVNRKSFVGRYDISDGGLPINPIGRTGVTGRGLLGKWGPNHAADPIVTRWKRNSKGKVEKQGGKKILEFVCVQRRDTKEWAIPGGMVDADEEVSLTLKREFGEEALNSLEEEHKEQTKKDLELLFKNGEVIYKGYVDDPRNTDNSWMETVACNFHDQDGTTAGRIPLAAGDDAQGVRWLPIDGPLQLYASHSVFIEQVCKRRKAFFAPE